MIRTRPVDVFKDIITPVAWAFIVFWVFIAVNIGVYAGVRNYETDLFPVISNFRITNPVVLNDRLFFNPSFDKRRDCELVDKSWYVRRKNGEPAQVYIGFPSRKPGNQSAPVGQQTRTAIEVGQGEYPDAISQEGYLFHDCNGYKLRTKIGPFPIYR